MTSKEPPSESSNLSRSQGLPDWTKEPPALHTPAGTPGASARREGERRRAARERRLRERWGPLGGLAVALSKQPQHERSWEIGARGEQTIARSLQRRCGESVSWLFDRRIPGRRTNIDLIAFAPSGVWVIDAKDYTGKVRVTNPLFGKPKLLIRGRDKTGLIDGLERQVKAVHEATQLIDPAIEVHGALCFHGRTELPLLRTLRFRGYPLFYPRRLAAYLRKSGPFTRVQLEELRARLAVKFPEA